MYFKQILLAVATSTFLLGCMHDTNRIEIGTKPVERKRLDLVDPVPVTLEDVQWIVITEENASQVFADLKGRGLEPVIIGLQMTGDGNAVVLNQERLKVLVEQYKVLLMSYRKYYEPPLPVK